MLDLRVCISEEVSRKKEEVYLALNGDLNQECKTGQVGLDNVVESCPRVVSTVTNRVNVNVCGVHDLDWQCGPFFKCAVGFRRGFPRWHGSIVHHLWGNHEPQE